MVLSETSVIASDCEDLACTLPHSPHRGEIAGKEGLCQGRALCAAKRSQSLDTSRFPAMLVDVGGSSPRGFVRNIFDSFLLAKVPVLDRGKDFVSAHVLSCIGSDDPLRSHGFPKRT